MDEVSEFFKNGLRNLHKNAIEKKYQQKTLKDRMNIFKNTRRETRNTVLFQKRKINENMTPISTPQACNNNITSCAKRKDDNKPSKRLEMLQKWKTEKEKKKQEEMKKKKPLFKVCHAPEEFGLPNLMNVNKKIKGKSIKIDSNHSEFAPPNHKFQAPKNIKPIQLNCINTINNPNSKTNNDAKSKSPEESKKLPKAIEKKDNTRKNPRLVSQSKFEAKQLSNNGAIKNSMNSTDSSKKKGCSKSKDKVLPKVKEISAQDQKTEFKNSPKIIQGQKSSVKTVGWNLTQTNGDAVVIKYSTPKTAAKQYKKTPHKERKLDMPDKEFSFEISGKVKSSESPPVTSQHSGERVRTRSSRISSATGSASPDFPVNIDLAEYDSTVYLSPFVTVSRGKTTARKEYQVRQSSGDFSPKLGVDILNGTSPKAGADYFLKKLNYEINRIEGMCNMWDDYKNSEGILEAASDMIDVAIGQSKLLISKKFQQFRNLTDQCRSCKYAEKPVTCMDLHGFWDMLYQQVEDLDKRFNNLNLLRANNWQEILPEKKPIVKRGRGRPKKASGSAALKNYIKTARNMKKRNAEEDANIIIPQNDDLQVFSEPIPNKTTGNRRSLRISLLSNQTRNRISSSPGLTMMKISQAIKHGDGITPNKSILKSDLTKSGKRITKTVLFKDNLEDNETSLVSEKVELKNQDIQVSVEDTLDKENNVNEINLISFSPLLPRRKSKY